ncbi:TMEM175 family protein [Streptomyces sp. 6N106]|uniref:TMEM175 family protein n=1 Tax=Streptomyces sp. 6N106 TaxID=3457418 RepID=UPI003FCF9775
MAVVPAQVGHADHGEDHGEQHQPPTGERLSPQLTRDEGHDDRHGGQNLEEAHARREEALPSAAGYLLSFVVVGALWISHHRLFRMTKVVDGPLLHLDLALMALVAAPPFPTKIVTEYHSNAIATSLYAGTIAVAALLIAAMATRLLRRPSLRGTDIPRSLFVQSLQHAAGVALIFGSSVPVAVIISSHAAEYWWLLAVPVRYYLGRRHISASKHAAVTPSHPAP